MSETILVVDDSSEMLRFLRSLLEMNGYEVQCAENGGEALRLARKIQPEVILLDVNLPDTDGISLCKKLRSGADPFPGKIIMISSYGDSKRQIDAHNLGANDYLTKPFKPGILLAKIKSCMKDLSTHYREDRDHVSKGVFRLNLHDRTLLVNHRKVSVLTDIQAKIIKILLEQSPRPVSSLEILKELKGPNADDPRTIEVHIHHLRKRLGKTRSRLKNVMGKGYTLIF